MTKFEYLRTQSPETMVFTWKALGSMKASDSTKIYSKDSIYLIKVKNSELNECLVLCLEDTIKTEQMSWNKARIFDFPWGEITFGSNIVSPSFKVLLLKEDYNGVDQSSQEFKDRYAKFVPYENLNKTASVTIDENTYQRIISVLGTPFIREDELEYTREEITDLAIRPALEEYFHWVPPVRETTINSSEGSTGTSETYKENEKGEWVATSGNSTSGGGLMVDMPSDAYGVVGLSLQQSGQSLNTNILSPMFYALEQSMYSGFSYTALTGVYNGRNPYTNTNSIGGMLGSRAASQALINYTRRVHYEGPYDRSDGTKYIKVYSTVSGVFNIWWAINSLNFKDVEYANKRRVIEYAQACVKELFGNLRRLAKSDIPGQYDYEKWIQEAQQTKQTITDEWKKLVKYAGIIRGSL